MLMYLFTPWREFAGIGEEDLNTHCSIHHDCNPMPILCRTIKQPDVLNEQHNPAQGHFSSSSNPSISFHRLPIVEMHHDTN